MTNADNTANQSEICHTCHEPIGTRSAVVKPRTVWHLECHPDEQRRPDIVGALRKIADTYSDLPELLRGPVREAFESVARTAVRNERRAASPDDIAVLELAADVLERSGSWAEWLALKGASHMLRGEPWGMDGQRATPAKATQ